MTLKQVFIGVLSSTTIALSGCGGSGGGGGSDYSATPATPEPTYYGTPTSYSVSDSVRVIMKAKFFYRQLDFTPGSGTNGLAGVVSLGNAAPIPYAEFHIYSGSTRIQQGETTTNGTADFRIPNSPGTYTLKVFSRALNSYLKVSVLNDIYANTPYSISQDFTVSAGDISSGTKDISSTPVYAHADENISSKVEGGAFNIMFDILLGNEYVRRNIEKNGDTAGVPSTDTNKWWVADKVSVYWKAGFNPSTYINNSNPLSFYSQGERKLYILGGINGDVKTTDTDHFDDSIILHEYGHFLEDVYGNSKSPGGSHNGNFVLDPRLSWSEGWANYFQAAVLTGSEAFGASAAEDRLPSNKKFQYYVDTYGYKGGGGNAGVSVSFNLAAVGTSTTEPDSVFGELPGTGIFREISVSRSLYKSSRQIASTYATSKPGGGLSFKNYWKVFSGEEKNVSTHNNPASYSFANTTQYPVPSLGLFYWMLTKNSVSSSQWDDIVTEEKQSKTTKDYGYLLSSGSGCTYTFSTGTTESKMSSGDVSRSNPQVNNDFYLYYHDGSATTLAISYTTAGSSTLDLDLYLYSGASYLYLEDTYLLAGRTTPTLVKYSRNAGTNSESVSLAGLPAGYYMLNVKINAYGKVSSQVNGSADYTITKNGAQQCGTERP